MTLEIIAVVAMAAALIPAGLLGYIYWMAIYG